MQIQEKNVELLHKYMIFLSLISQKHHNFVRKLQSVKHFHKVFLIM